MRELLVRTRSRLTWEEVVPAVAAIAGLTVLGVNLALRGIDHTLLAGVTLAIGGLGGFWSHKLFDRLIGRG